MVGVCISTIGSFTMTLVQYKGLIGTGGVIGFLRNTIFKIRRFVQIDYQYRYTKFDSIYTTNTHDPVERSNHRLVVQETVLDQSWVAEAVEGH